MQLKNILPDPILTFLKRIAFRHLKMGAPKYDYNVEPIQLATIINELIRLENVNGNILEVGLARGMTSRFICEHFKTHPFNHTFYALDTFDSFKDEDVNFEIQDRGKSLSEQMRAFRYNDYKTWCSNFKQYDFVQPIKCDCASFDYKSLHPIKFTFLDVDLYQPTRKALPKIFDSTVDGGVIIVDDVKENDPYDGSSQAYLEFCDTLNVEPKFIGNKCGLIYK